MKAQSPGLPSLQPLSPEDTTQLIGTSSSTQADTLKSSSDLKPFFLQFVVAALHRFIYRLLWGGCWVPAVLPTDTPSTHPHFLPAPPRLTSAHRRVIMIWHISKWHLRQSCKSGTSVFYLGPDCFSARVLSTAKLTAPASRSF